MANTGRRGFFGMLSTTAAGAAFASTIQKDLGATDEVFKVEAGDLFVLRTKVYLRQSQREGIYRSWQRVFPVNPPKLLILDGGMSLEIHKNVIAQIPAEKTERKL